MKTNALKNTMPKMSGYRRRLQDKREYVFSRLFELGLSALELARPEANHLPSLLHTNETIEGVVAGQSDRGHMMLVATDKRVILLDCKPFYIDTEDIAYDIVSRVKVTNIGPFYTVTLQTRVGDFSVYTLYEKAAKLFKRYINSKSLSQTHGGKV